MAVIFVCSVHFRGSLNIQRMKSGEKIFRQMKQNSARVVHPTRRDFVKYHGKDSADSRREEFLEVPYSKKELVLTLKTPKRVSHDPPLTKSFNHAIIEGNYNKKWR